jgi:hypothetical protein
LKKPRKGFIAPWIDLEGSAATGMVTSTFAVVPMGKLRGTSKESFRFAGISMFLTMVMGNLLCSYNYMVNNTVMQGGKGNLFFFVSFVVRFLQPPRTRREKRE